MTSDLVQNKYSRSKMKPDFPCTQTLAYSVPSGLEITRDQHFLDGSLDLFDVLARHSQEKDGLKRSIDATLALLKQAQTTIESAEKKIGDQHKRIQGLEELNTIDELTGLNNSRGLFNALKRETARMKRDEARNTLLVLVELDNAEAIKTQNGEDAYKSALKLVAQILNSEARAMDMVARLDEDEFILMLPNASVENTLSRAQGLAVRLNNLSIVSDNEEVKISVSIGLKSYGSNDAPESLLPREEKDTSTM